MPDGFPLPKKCIRALIFSVGIFRCISLCFFEEQIGEKVMQIEDQDWQRVESQLFQIKVLLIILIDLCILGFYGLARAGWDDISRPMSKIAIVFMVTVYLLSAVIVMVWAEDRRKSTNKEKDEIKQIGENKTQN